MEHPSGRRILIVDDDPEIAALLACVFALGGHTTRWAPDGPRALELLEAELPDLLTLDVNMPGMSGIEVLRQLRASPRLQGLQVVVLTSREDVLPQMRLQADAVMTKPFDIAALLATAASLLAVAPPRERAVGDESAFAA